MAYGTSRQSGYNKSMYWHQLGEGAWQPGAMGWGHEWMLGILALALPFILIVMVWSVVWKGLALWHAARRGQYWWFAAMLVINTLGILEIVYLFGFAKLSFAELFSFRDRGHSNHEHTHHDHAHHA